MTNQPPFQSEIRRVIPNISGIYPDDHSKQLAKFFGSIPTEDELSRLKESCKDIKVFFLCFTNRCGSNFVAQAIASDGSISQAGENLNFDTVINNCSKRHITKFVDYLIWLIRHQTSSSGVCGIKCSAGQLIELINFRIIDQFISSSFIFVKRNDVVKQAISLLIASQTRHWTSTQSSDSNIVLTLNSDQLFLLMSSISNQNACFEAIFSLASVNVKRIVYEEFVKDPAEHISSIGNHLSIANLQYISSQISYRKQSSQINQLMYDAMKSEFSI
jgi:LPS sulfotransferase NodH